jgi:hypothetical protein
MLRRRVGRVALIAAALVVVSSLGAGVAAASAAGATAASAAGAAVPPALSVKPSPQCTSTHRVLANDSWTRLAARFKVPQARLLRLNSASLSTPLFIGDTVCLAVRSTSSSGRGAAGSTGRATGSGTTTTTTTTTTTVASTPTAPTVTVAEPVACRPIQVSWRGASPDTGLYSLQWVRVSAAGTYDFNTYTMWNVRGTSTTMPNWLARGATYALRIFAMRADWDGLTHSNQNVTPHSAIVAFTLPSCNQPATTTTTTVAPTPCAQGGTCVVGDTGPGGGIVFYVHPSGGTFACGSALTSTCRYLEAAPTSGASAWTDARYVWSGNTSTAVGADAQSEDLGSGYKNTLAMVNQSSTPSRAGTIARAYRGPNNLTDWYLPARNELNELCKYARNTGQSAGGGVRCAGGTTPTDFAAFIYWSSSEGTGILADTTAWFQDFSDGDLDRTTKSTDYHVRPVRAFGGTLGCADGGTCVVGDTGPGGGTVFYVHSGGGTFSCGVALVSTCRYLEVAPADIAGTHAWCSNTSALLNATYTGIGAGMENTTTADPMCTTGAIQQAADYTNNGRSDWYLPSKDELNELCKYAKNTGQAAGGATLCSGGADAAVRGFTATNYWSSSEDSATTAWQHSFFDGSRGANSKWHALNRVRVVRAFG